MGHKNIHITLDTYADVFNRMNFGAIEKFEKYIDELEAKEEKQITSSWNVHKGIDKGMREER